jgi:hypothetical protein
MKEKKRTPNQCEKCQNCILENRVSRLKILQTRVVTMEGERRLQKLICSELRLNFRRGSVGQVPTRPVAGPLSYS